MKKKIEKSLGKKKNKVKPASAFPSISKTNMEKYIPCPEESKLDKQHTPQISTQTSWISRIADYCLSNGVNPDDLVAAHIELSKNKITPEIALKLPKANKSNFATDLRNKKCGLS